MPHCYSLSFPDIWQESVRTHPDWPFLIYSRVDQGQTDEYTYQEFSERVNQVANLLIDLNIQKGDQVAVHLPNSVELVESLLACLMIGAVFVPLNIAYTASECDYVLKHCPIKLLIASSDSELIGRTSIATLPVGSQLSVSEYWQASRRQPTRLKEQREINWSDLAEIMFTSGTTAHPKGVMLTQGNMVFSGQYVNWQLAMNDRDRYYTTMAASHVNFQLSALMPVITANACLILADRYSASRFWAEVCRYQATQVQSMSMIARTTMKQLVTAKEQDHQVRFIHYFLPLTDQEKTTYEQRFSVSLINNYGSTESLVGVLTDTPYGPKKWPSIGRPGLGYQAKILDEKGKECEPGKVGQILIHGIPGYSLMAGYFQDPVSTAQVLTADGWFYTGDFGYVDSHGWFYFVGRNQDLIKRAGENVSALEVEDVLSRCPGVAAVAVVGVADDCRDEAIKAFIIPQNEQLTKRDILDYATEHLAYFKIPKYIEFRSEFPRGEYGKIQKNKL